jgi:hypothetical protein
VHQILSIAEIGDYNVDAQEPVHSENKRVEADLSHAPISRSPILHEPPKEQEENTGTDLLLHELIKCHNTEAFASAYDTTDISDPVSVFHDAIDAACVHHKLDIVKLVLDSESKQLLVNSMHPKTLRTALCTAASSDYEDLILLLLDNGAGKC